MSQEIRIPVESLRNFGVDVFRKLGLPDKDAWYSADILLQADMREIPSHGFGRLKRYIAGIKTGQMKLHPERKILMESEMSLVVDADGGMGAPVSSDVMHSVIEKAEKNGAAFGCIRNSNHFGIAGYYAMMALEHDMIGIAMTNTAALGVPSFGRQVMFGTNPLAFAAPANQEKAFVLDMSTTVVTRGKLEVCAREGKELPPGWAVDKNGKTARDGGTMLRDMLQRTGGGILPLGGEGELYSGYKGYGLAVMVDILCAVLCGAPFGADVFDTEETSARVSHFFGAIKIDHFRDPAAFRQDMDRMLAELRNTPRAEGAERVWFAGEKEFENHRIAEKEGVSLSENVLKSLKEVALEFQIPFL